MVNGIGDREWEGCPRVVLVYILLHPFSDAISSQCWSGVRDPTLSPCFVGSCRISVLSAPMWNNWMRAGMRYYQQLTLFIEHLSLWWVKRRCNCPLMVPGGCWGLDWEQQVKIELWQDGVILNPGLLCSWRITILGHGWSCSRQTWYIIWEFSWTYVSCLRKRWQLWPGEALHNCMLCASYTHSWTKGLFSHSFISWSQCLVYYNMLHMGIPLKSIQKLQLVQIQ